MAKSKSQIRRESVQLTGKLPDEDEQGLAVPQTTEHAPRVAGRRNSMDMKEILDELEDQDLHDIISSGIDTRAVKVLLAIGADVNGRDDHANTPLHKAAMWNSDPEVIRLLVNSGGEINAYNQHGRTPLYYAQEWKRNPEVIMAIREAGGTF